MKIKMLLPQETNIKHKNVKRKQIKVIHSKAMMKQ